MIHLFYFLEWQHWSWTKETIQKLLQLHSSTQDPVSFSLDGVLPGEATLHLKQLTIFGMITHLPENILKRIAKEMIICSPQSEMTWFCSAMQPLSQLWPASSSWTTVWPTEANAFQENSEGQDHHPHPMWLAATDSYSDSKMVIVARMLGDHFPCGSLLKHFSLAAGPQL